MDRRTGLIVVGWILVALVVAGIAIVSLSYVVVLPNALVAAYFPLTAVTVVVGGVLCRPYLRIASRGHVMGPAGRHVGWWVPVLAAAGFLTMWAVIFSSAVEGPKGDPIRTSTGGYALRYKGSITEVSRVEWLAARQLETRVLSAAPAS